MKNYICVNCKETFDSKPSKCFCGGMTFEKTQAEAKYKMCKLVNGNFSWILEVDGKTIAFNGASNADYFAKHYESIGYKVEWV